MRTNADRQIKSADAVHGQQASIPPVRCKLLLALRGDLAHGCCHRMSEVTPNRRRPHCIPASLISTIGLAAARSALEATTASGNPERVLCVVSEGRSIRIRSWRRYFFRNSEGVTAWRTFSRRSEVAQEGLRGNAPGQPVLRPCRIAARGTSG